MFKSNWCKLVAVSIIVAVIMGAIILALCYPRHCNDNEIIQQTDSAGFVEPTDGTEKNYVLDAQYASSYLEATSNYEMCEVNSQFAEKWKQEAELYLNKICEIADEDLKQAIIAGQESWENTYPIQMQENLTYLQYVYGSGSVVPVIHSKYDYDLQRERAIELYEMYNNIKRIWDVFQEE